MKNISVKAIRTLPLFAFFLVIIEIVLSNQLAGSGKAIRSVDNAIDALRQDNNLLQQHIASASSLVSLSVKAREIGFIEPVKSQYVTLMSDQLPVAFNNPQ